MNVTYSVVLVSNAINNTYSFYKKKYCSDWIQRRYKSVGMDFAPLRIGERLSILHKNVSENFRLTKLLSAKKEGRKKRFSEMVKVSITKFDFQIPHIFMQIRLAKNYVCHVPFAHKFKETITVAETWPFFERKTLIRVQII